MYDYADRKKELRAEKLRKKVAEAKVGVNELIDLAGQIGITGDPRDIEELIGENKKQAAALDSLADETGEMELIEEMAVLKARLITSSKKLRNQRDEMLDQGKPKPTFSREDSEVKTKSSSSHWYADQSRGSRLTAMNPSLTVFMIFLRKGWSTGRIWLTSRER